MVDAAHSWAPKTLTGYQGNLRRFQRFCTGFQIPQPHLRLLPTSPPHGTHVLMLWSIEHYTCQLSSRATQEFVGYNGARSLWSALASLSTWTLSLGPTGSAYRS
jgi:hypothetical protein